MSHLFSSFDPGIGVLSLNLNWVSALLVMLIWPSSFWLSGVKIMNKLTIELNKDMEVNLGSKVTPGLSFLMVIMTMYIFVNNLLGLTVYVFTATSHLVFTLSLSLPMWMGMILYSFLKYPTWVLSHLVPLGTPKILMPLMVIIELISNLIRPLTLSVRLMANMTAGHLLLHLSGSSIVSLGLPVFLVEVLLMILELGVSAIQAYVFSMLMTLYVGESNTWSSH